MASKKDEAWETIFQRKRNEIESALKNKGYFDISPNEIKNLTGQEPRLITKFDHKSSLPKILDKLNLSLLSVSNRSYRLAHTNPFLTISKLEQPLTIFVSPSIELTTITKITNEADALHFAYASGVIHFISAWLHSRYVSPPLVKNKFLEEIMSAFLSGRWRRDHNDMSSPLPTATGRRGATHISFHLPEIVTTSRAIPYEVSGTQIEVDAGFESQEQVLLIEAKMGAVETISLRQILYPLLHYNAVINNIGDLSALKNALPPSPYVNPFKRFIFSLLMTYEPSTEEIRFSLYDPRQSPPMYELPFIFKRQDSSENWRKLKEEVLRLPVNIRVCDYEAPYPQADSMPRIIATLLSLYELGGTATVDEIFSNQDISTRQYDYYVNILIWLRLAKRLDGMVALNADGEELCKMGPHRRLAEIYKRAAADPLVNFALRNRHHLPQFNNQINNLFDQIPNSERISSMKTRQRRWQTIKSWAEYFDKIE